MNIEKEYNREYNFHKLRKEEYEKVFKENDEFRQKQQHHFLRELEATKDKYPIYSKVPKNYKMMEKISNLRGSFLTSQETIDPFPYIEMGDLAHRLVYHEKAMLTHEELEMLHDVPDAQYTGPMESIELARVVLGFEINKELINQTKVEHALLEKYAGTVDDYFDTSLELRTVGWRH